MIESEKLWRETHRAEYLAYQREYHRKNPKERRKPAPGRKKYTRSAQEEKTYQSATPQEISDRMLQQMPWNPRICEHGPGYDCPSAILPEYKPT